MKKASRHLLVLASLFFYGYWNPKFLPLILISVIVNFYLGKIIHEKPEQAKKFYILGLVFNIGLLVFFKYTNFLIENLNYMGVSITSLDIILPLAISFFTFQQIAYLSDVYFGKSESYNLEDYCLFVTFFPQLIAGPIVHHKEMMPQFSLEKDHLPNSDNIAKGIYIFLIGLFKKVMIADTFASWVAVGFDQSEVLTFVEAWVVSFYYTFQLYFDFSGYTDMAIGIALMFNIILPLNFNSPYKAVSIQDFWRRWHMTLSRFLRDYIYIPLGGSRKSESSTYFNLFVTFLIGGIWHGAGWTFLAWGAMHGIGVVFHRFFQKIKQNLKIELPIYLSGVLTFLFVNFAWVFFRAKTFADAAKVFKGMFCLNGITLPLRAKSFIPLSIQNVFNFGGIIENIYLPSNEHIIPQQLTMVLFLLLGFTLVFQANSMQIKERFKPDTKHLIYFLTLTSTLFFLSSQSEFLYFDF